MHLGVSSTCCGERKNNGKKISSTTHLENCDHPIRLHVFFLCFGWWYGGASIGAAIFCNYQTGFARISIMAGILLHVTHYFFHRCFCCPQVFFQSSVNRHFLHQVELDVPVTCVTILGAWWPKETIWMKTPISGYRLADWTSFSQVGEVYIQMNVPFLQFRWLRRHHWRHAFLSEWKTPWIMDWKTHNVWKNGCHIARPYFRNRQLGYWK